jgi:hypothetical protein
MEEVVVRWLAFLRAKRYLSEVSGSGIIYHDRYHDWNTPSNPLRDVRMAAKSTS